MVLVNKLKGLEQGVPLAGRTTICLGGDARYFVSCRSVDDLKSALEYAHSEGLRVEILGGGSNVVFPDEGFDGIVIQVGMQGIQFDEENENVNVTAAAGETWDRLVEASVSRNYSGVECLSGIPGSVGATPIQNVGAYGQEVKDTILNVTALDRETLEPREFSASECAFGYRNSRFKSTDRNKYVVTGVVYRLSVSGEPTLKYEELREFVQSRGILENREPGKSKLELVRESVLALRKKKSMLVDPGDPNLRSVGSFFVNPILSDSAYLDFLRNLKAEGIERAPSYRAADGIKIPAAWLVEKSGFKKGYRKGGVGISSNHSLALVNYSGTARELLALAADIEEAVQRKFGIRLEREAVVI